MTRSNLNFIYQNKGEAPRTLFYYHNGDQYPIGLRDFYNVLDFINKGIEHKGLTAEMFKKWILKNYDNSPVDLGIGGQPKIYYTDGFITDYSYVFEENKVAVWEWDKKIFGDDLKKFKKWIVKQK